MEELWKPLKGYEGMYEISNLGKVKSLSRPRYCGHEGSKPQIRKEILLKERTDRLGYKRVKLQDGIKLVHRLLAETFIPNPNNYKEVNHIDGDKSNNNLDNLQWCTRSENMKHAFKMGLTKARRGEECNKSKLTRSEVKEIRELYETGKFTQTKLGQMFNVSSANIHSIVKFKTWKDVI